MVNLNEIDAIYKRYGYSIRTVNGIRIYEYKQGRYFGADFFNYSNSETLPQLIDEYAKQGFAYLIREYKSSQEVEEELFKGFFQVDSFRNSLNRKYDTFIKKQLDGLPEDAQYKYISSPYTYIKYDAEGIPEIKEEEVISESNSVVKKVTTLVKETTEPLFVIIEAAAGYGKTCSAYEILKGIKEVDENNIPFFIELSRNREARIFKHILQNEIEQQFYNVVKSDVVLHEIINGRIPLIIDGFDELLSKDLSKTSAQLRDVESMLATILKLLQGKAKIIITSRKTAIFSGEEFYNWIQDSTNKYQVARFSISEPNVDNWLSEEQLQIIEEADFPIRSIANPVLLSYIRNIPLSELKDLTSNSKNIVDKYFEFLCNREKKRQNIQLSFETQLRIFKKLTRFMTEFDIKTESKSLIKDLLQDYNLKIFDEYRRNTIIEPKQTNDELADILSNHAFLDRKKNNNIGFINEFVFGILIGRNLIENKYQEHYGDEFTNIISQEFAQIALSAFKVQPNERRKLLWNVFHDNSFDYDSHFLFYRDVYLIEELKSKYKGGIIEGYCAENLLFIETNQFEDYIFNYCNFEGCLFSKCAFINTSFVNCKFFNCSWDDNANPINGNRVYFAGSTSNNDFIDTSYKEDESSQECEKADLDFLILNMFVKKEGKVSNMKRLSTMREELKEYGFKSVDKAISALKKRSYINIDGGLCFIQREGIAHFNNTYK